MKIKYKDVEIEAVVKGDEVYFIHPQTGQLCENVSQTFVGWSYQDDALNEQMQELIEKINSNENDVWEYIRDDVDYEFH